MSFSCAMRNLLHDDHSGATGNAGGEKEHGGGAKVIIFNFKIY